MKKEPNQFGVNRIITRIIKHSLILVVLIQ